jgi:hypothetical protein
VTDRPADRGEKRSQALQVFRLGDQQVELPADITIADWALERRRVQNPRIRSLLGCVRTLEGVLDSNYAILHCSPQRLHEIWTRVLRIVDLIRSELAPLLREPSCIPALEAERRNTQMALELLDSTVLRNLDKFPVEIESGQLMRVRKLLCVSMGKLHAFLQDAFARIVASDPRSRFDADYFLSRRFPHDVEEAEWLWVSVAGLKKQLESIHQQRLDSLVAVAKQLGSDYTPAGDESWLQLEEFLDTINSTVTPRLREVLSLRGIRFDEMEVLDRYASELPSLCSLVLEIGALIRGHQKEIASLSVASGTGREVIEATQMLLQGATNRRLSSLMIALDERLRDLEAFVPFWLEEIGRRRALMLRPFDEGETESLPAPGGSEASLSDE